MRAEDESGKAYLKKVHSLVRRPQGAQSSGQGSMGPTPPMHGDPGRGRPAGTHLWSGNSDTKGMAGCGQLKMWGSSCMRRQPRDLHFGDICPDFS